MTNLTEQQLNNPEMESELSQGYLFMRRILHIVALGFWGCYAIAAICGWDLLADFLSPLTVLVAIVLLVLCSKALNVYKNFGLFIGLGILFWFIADLLYFAQNFTDNTTLQTITDSIYWVPDYCFAAAMLFYVYREFSRSIFSRIVANAVVISIFLIVLVSGLITNRFLPDQKGPLFSIHDSLLILFYAFSIVIATVILVCVIIFTKFKNLSKIIIGSGVILMLYNLLELRYVILLFLDQDPENKYLDIVYVLLEVSMACILSSEAAGKHKSAYRHILYRDKHPKTIWFFSFAVIVLDIFLFAKQLLDTTHFFFLMISVLIYLVVYKAMQNNELTEQLLETERLEKEYLEYLVAEKTRELQTVNTYLEEVSNTDALTGLYNRRYGLKLIDDLVGADIRSPFAIYSMDLNYFKPINDNYGHDMGDKVLKEVALRLKAIAPSDCTAVRVGGDEFLIIYSPKSVEPETKTIDMQRVEKIALDICTSLDQPVDCDRLESNPSTETHIFQLSISVGVACYPMHTDNITDLFKYADEAMYSIKHTKKLSTYKIYENINADTKVADTEAADTEATDTEAADRPATTDNAEAPVTE